MSASSGDGDARLTRAQLNRLREVVADGERVYNGRSYLALSALKLLNLVTWTHRYIDGGEQVSDAFTVRPTLAGRAYLAQLASADQPSVPPPTVSEGSAHAR